MSGNSGGPVDSDGGQSSDLTFIPDLDVDPDRLAGREYDVTLEYTVTFRLSQIAGPEAQDAIERAREVAFPGGPIDPLDWDLVHTDVVATCPIWMDSPDAPKAVDWLDEPHVPSEETYWDDTRHFAVECGDGDSPRDISNRQRAAYPAHFSSPMDY